MQRSHPSSKQKSFVFGFVVIVVGLGAFVVFVFPFPVLSPNFVSTQQQQPWLIVPLRKNETITHRSQSLCKQVNVISEITSQSFTQSIRELWACSSRACCSMWIENYDNSPNATRTNSTTTTSTTFRQKKSIFKDDDESVPTTTKITKDKIATTPTSAPYPPMRMAVVQAGLLSTWFATETIDYVVRPMAKLGWQVDLYVQFQNYTGSLANIRYNNSPNRRLHHQGKTAQEIQNEYEQNVTEAGGRVIYFSVKDELQQTGITGEFEWGPPNFQFRFEVAPEAPRKANILRQFIACWEVYQKVMAHERTSGQFYDWVLRLRDDAGWLVRPAFELADPKFAYFRELGIDGTGGIPDKALLLPGRHAMGVFQHMAYGLFTTIFWHKVVNPEHLLCIGLEELNVPHKVARGHVDRNGVMDQFGLAVADLTEKLDEGVCYRRDYIGGMETWPKGLKESQLISKICNAF
eukprot:c9980_g1_i1.p1 GENE.c9980_g1_i1~~c9980_g1_i1.p1  ORF type:complete len:463 (+),score=101.52 c9980_g1_i1:215-1603(+)